MRQSNQIDLRTEGGQKVLSLAPGGIANYQISAQQSRIGAGGGGRGLYNYVRSAKFQVSFTVTQPAEGGVEIYPDSFPKVLASFNWWTPLFGTWYDPNVVTGPLMKHLVELHQRNYQYDTFNRHYIAATGGSYTRNFEVSVPVGGWETFEFPDQFDHWLGWLDSSYIEIYAAAVDALGNGSEITNVTIRGQLEMVPFGEIVIPPFVLLRRYTQAAAGSSSGPQLIGVGGGGSLEGTDDAARLMGMFFSHNAGGFTGSGTADEIATMSLPWRDQAQTTLMAGFFQRYLRNQKWLQHPVNNADDAGGRNGRAQDIRPLYDMLAAIANGPGALNAAAARYTPLVWPEESDLISQLQKVKGNYPLDMSFTADQSGLFTVYTLEVKQYSQQKCGEMLAAMGIDPTKVNLVPKLGRKNKGGVDPDKLFCMPRSVEAK